MIDKDLKKIAVNFGIANQENKLDEEIGELLQAKARKIANGTYENFKNYIEEITDVEIILQQIKYLLGCTAMSNDIKKEKIDRTLQRIKSGYYEK